MNIHEAVVADNPSICLL